LHRAIIIGIDSGAHSAVLLPLEAGIDYGEHRPDDQPQKGKDADSRPSRNCASRNCGGQDDRRKAAASPSPGRVSDTFIGVDLSDTGSIIVGGSVDLMVSAGDQIFPILPADKLYFFDNDSNAVR
jgi:hypothetical protein